MTALPFDPAEYGTFGRSELHLPEGVELREALIMLAAFDQAYAELVWIDATLEEASTIIRARDEESWHRDTVEATARRLE